MVHINMKLKPIKDNDDDVPIFLHIYVVSHAHLLPCVGPSFQNRPEKFLIITYTKCQHWKAYRNLIDI
jgi:hypothetical protein